MLPLLPAGLPAGTAGAFSTRAGGVSAPPYDALDLGDHVGDDPAAVQVNRERLAAAVGASGLALMGQVHGREVAVVDGPGTVEGVDALVTTAPGLGLVVLAADCLPVLLADAGAGVVGVAHAGRQGLASGVLQAAVAAMRDLGAGELTAVVGPAACGRCYEVPDGMADEVDRVVPGSRGTTRTGTPSVDLLAGATGLLRAAGVADVRAVGGCTIEQPELFFSYRRDGRTGRHAGIVLVR